MSLAVKDVESEKQGGEKTHHQKQSSHATLHIISLNVTRSDKRVTHAVSVRSFWETDSHRKYNQGALI